MILRKKTDRVCPSGKKPAESNKKHFQKYFKQLIKIFDQARDESSQQLITRIESSRYLEIETILPDAKEIEDAFRRGSVKMAVVFPSNFGQDLAHLKKEQVQIITDASYPNTANTLTNYLSSVIAVHQDELNGNSENRIQAHIRMLYNPQLKGVHNFVPGVIPGLS